MLVNHGAVNMMIFLMSSVPSRSHDASAVKEARATFAQEIQRFVALQFLFDRQWKAVKVHCCSSAGPARTLHPFVFTNAPCGLEAAGLSWLCSNVVVELGFSSSHLYEP